MSSVVVLWLMLGYLYFFIFDKDSCFFHLISLCGLLHGIVGSFPSVFVVVTYFVVLSAVFFIPRGRACSTTWMCVSSPGC